MPSITKQRPNNEPAPRKTGGLFDKLVDVADATIDQGIKIAFFGKSGTGKTVLSSTFPKPMLHVVASNSAAGETLSISNIPGIKVHTIDDEEELQQLVKEQKETQRFKTFCVDHLSGYSDIVMRKILAKNNRTKPITDDWQEGNELIKRRAAECLSLPCHVIINTQERTFNVKDDGVSVHELLVPNVTFGLSPGVATWLAPAVDYMLHTFIRMGIVNTGRKMMVLDKEVDVTEEKPEFCLRLAPHPVYNIKFRAPKGTKIPEVMVDPTFDKIMRLIKGSTK